jgi:NADH-quinone oxidoreductase subunit L
VVEAHGAQAAAAAIESSLLRWIPLLPLFAAAIHGVMIGLVRRSLPRGAVIGLSCGAVGLSFVASVFALFQLIALPEGQRVLVDNLYTWIGAGKFSAEASFLVDPISAVMILVVTGVGFLIHVYSIGYMDDDHREDKGFQRFFCYLNLFTFSMLVLVMGDNLLLLFLGWEGVGLCSYLLIGFWYADRWNAYCGSKAFIVNRIGDFGFLVGIFLLFAALAAAGKPTIAFRDIASSFHLIAGQTVTLPDWLGFLPGAPAWRLSTLIGLCFFVGAMGKSAQLPLYVWLPDAMAGPTPVSALIHAATMVTAGVYMVCRMSFLYADAPGAAAVVAWTGGLTAIFAATIGIAQTDIKKVLAYSTVSQLGYMFLAAGCGGYGAAMFHLVTHAFFKALLFLGSGAVILAMHHEQDTDKMGGLRRAIPRTHAVFGIGVLAIAGTPFFSGFFSKDEILLTAYTADHIPGHRALWCIALVTAAITAFYMFRVHIRTFWGAFRGHAEELRKVHEPASTVLVPLYVLALLSIVAGYAGLPQIYGDAIGIPHSNSFANWLAPAVAGHGEHAVAHDLEVRLTLFAVLAAAVGAALAFVLYWQSPEIPQRIRESVPALWRLVREKYYVDEIFDALLVRPLVWLSDRVFFRAVDQGVVDGALVNGSARAVQGFAARGLKYAQSGFAQSYLVLMVVGAIAIVGWLVR